MEAPEDEPKNFSDGTNIGEWFIKAEIFKESLPSLI